MQLAQQVLRLHPELVSIWEQELVKIFLRFCLEEDQKMVSVPKSPWLGALAKPPEEHGAPLGKQSKANREQVGHGTWQLTMCRCSMASCVEKP